MSRLREIPEIRELDQRHQLIRIPRELDVPITRRVRNLIDTAEFRRLARISQLGLVSLVYPAAHHTRFEHSLGVYRLALLYLKHLSCDERFSELIEPPQATRLIVAALLHDLGHWPFCHPIEDIQLPGVPQHELFANSFLLEGELADLLRDEWEIQPREIVSLLSEKPRDQATQVLHSILSGPIDIDKMDYLVRDSLHAGVPYGQNFDQQRLIGSLCLNEAGDRLAISDKGRTAAEMMVFARYVMFSEVYWHHTVRAATAMLQRAFYLLMGDLDLDVLFRMDERQMIDTMLHRGGRSGAGELLSGLFGPQRVLYKRLAEYSYFQNQACYQLLTRRPFPWLSSCAEALASVLSRHIGGRIAPHEILFDAPPPEREVEFRVDVYFPKENVYRSLGDVSPVVRTLAQQQFDDIVKRVRIYIHPRLQASLASLANLDEAVSEAVERTDAS